MVVKGEICRFDGEAGPRTILRANPRQHERSKARQMGLRQYKCSDTHDTARMIELGF
jgi:hypothetical protein